MSPFSVEQGISSSCHSNRSCEQYPDEKGDGIQLRWAGKELAMDKKLSYYIGVNDKTKVTCSCSARHLFQFVIFFFYYFSIRDCFFLIFSVVLPVVNIP